VLQYHIMSREKKSAEETQIAKCDSDLSNKEKKSLLMTTNPAEGVGIKSIRVSGVATHPVTIKVRVFGPMNYRVRILRRRWM